MDLLDPFEVDDRHDADLQVGMPGEVDLVGDDAAVQSLVEEQVAFGEVAPLGELPRRRAELLRLLLVVDVGAGAAGSLAAVFREHLLEDFELVGLGVEMGEVGIAVLLLLGDLFLHRLRGRSGGRRRPR